MGQVNIKKRGNVYQYQFEIAKVNGKRKYINKSGFKTKNEAIEAGNKAYTEYLNAGVPFKECSISYRCSSVIVLTFSFGILLSSSSITLNPCSLVSSEA